LKGSRLARVVWPDEDNRIAQLHFNILKPFEVADPEFGEHSTIGKPEFSTRTFPDRMTFFSDI
jgi:hypothetical protein